MGAIRNLHNTVSLIPERWGVNGEEAPQKRGVWQGSALSAILFISFMEGMMTELGRALRNHPSGPHAYTPVADRTAGRRQPNTLAVLEEVFTARPPTRSVAFADDAALVAKDRNDATQALDTYGDFCEKRIRNVR